VAAASILGISRAVGETMILAIAAGMTLFLVTFALNVASHLLKRKFREVYD
jgi:ABC-type phosphate transport system permease subunit